ncbi:MAG TPA: CNNM domain-containing protein, partial [Desulfuromonadaceae bacterium]|nr:CNNM domain-containing protein [Desulfuromonadaceae bacterium]
LARAGKPSAKLLNSFLENPERFLWTILVGNTLANFIILSLIFIRIHDWLSGKYLWIIVSFAIVVFLFYTLLDLLPKMLFRAFPTQLCLFAARFFKPINLVLGVLVALVEGISTMLLRLSGGRAFTGKLFGNRDEMRAMMRETAPSATEHAMISRVLDLQHFTVRQIVVPFDKIVSIEAQTSLGDALKLAREKKFSRLPVWETREGRQRIAGLLMLGPLLFRTDFDLSRPSAAYMSPALFLPEDTRLEDALRKMQRSGERLAVVLARDGRETGVVSLEDILKVVFGEMNL